MVHFLLTTKTNPKSDFNVSTILLKILLLRKPRIHLLSMVHHNGKQGWLGPKL